MKAPGNSPLSETTPTPSLYPHSSSLRPRLIPSVSLEFMAKLISTLCFQYKHDYCTCDVTSCDVLVMKGTCFVNKNSVVELRPYVARLEAEN